LFICFRTKDSLCLTSLVTKWYRFLAHETIRLDRSLHQPGRYPHANQSIQVLLRLFRDAIEKLDNNVTSRHTSTALDLANLTLRIYFFTHTTRNCPSLMESVGRISFPLIQFSRAQFVTYKYYTGRYKLLQHSVSAAIDDLKLAFRHCWTNPSAYVNRRLIFFNLMVARLVVGALPCPGVLENFGYSRLIPLIRAYKQGRIADFHRACEANMDLLLPSGNYCLVRERCIMPIYRNLIQRVFNLLVDRRSDKPLFVSFSNILAALRLSTQDPTQDLMDVECLLTSMISQ
ncbi:hypothetical protein BJ085DRAFT_4323, partial [Dimargaris cristalligena]